MKTDIKILMIDDHPMIIEGYQNTLLSTKNEDQVLKIDIANNSEEAVKAINSARKTKQPYNVLFIDISLPATKDGTITSGEDLAAYAKVHLPDAKIVILTMFNGPHRILRIINNINPDGFLIKGDLTSNALANAFQTILINPPYYSETVTNCL